MLMTGPKEIEMINNSNIYETCKDPYLNEKEFKENRHQGIHSTNSLKAQLRAKRHVIQQ